MNRKNCKDEDSSTESNDDAKPHHFSNIAVEDTCIHVKAAVCSSAIRKKLKQSKLEKECKKCLECSTMKINNRTLEDHDAEDDDLQIEPYNLWMCLRCGSQLCGRSPQNEHALEHASADRSDSHAMVVNTKTLQVWCYQCNKEINAKLTPRLSECVEMVKREAEKLEIMPIIDNIEQKVRTTVDNIRAVMCDELPTPVASGSTITNTTMGVGDRAEGGTLTQPRLTNSCNSIRSTSAPKMPMYRDIRPEAAFKQPISAQSSVVDNLPRVRGLTNLGNTCFYNAVLQCLARTPFLLDVLQETQVAGEKFQLPGGPLTLNDGTETELRPISGELSTWGTLTQAFAETLLELQSGKVGVFPPSKLLKLLTNKCPQFAGADQHDSHELLRQLLENVRNEDLKRYHLVILTSLGLHKNTEPNSVDSTLKQKVKFYGMQAADRILCPEPVFRGIIVSTLTCQDCGHTSSRHEYFLDLSLPVTAEKPQPPIRRKGSPEPDYGYSAATKPMSTKERRRAKKANKTMAKREKSWLNSTQPQSSEAEPHIATASVEASSNAAGESGGGDADSGGDDDDNMSDADVEDNLTDDSQPKRSGVDQNGNQACGGATAIGPEKRDDTPENPNKEGVGDGNVECELGLSADGIANMMQKITINSNDQQEEQIAKKMVKSRRHRTYSHADWGSTLAPRYHCEDNECSIQSCFNAFTAMELMTGNNKVCCDACTERTHGKDAKKSINTNATKQFLVSSPPAVLILHLKRFQVGPRGILRKITRAVTFPCLLDIAPFCGSKVKTLPNVKRDQKKLLYSLYGIVEHSGTMHGGHYVAYVKVRPLITKDDPRWNFLPKGTKAELDQEDEQTLLLERELALEKARQMTSTVTGTARDSDDALTSSSSSAVSSSSQSSTCTGASDGEAEEGAVGYTPKPEALPDVDPPPGRWYYVSDSHVVQTTEEKVLNAQAYLLFYERIF